MAARPTLPILLLTIAGCAPAEERGTIRLGARAAAPAAATTEIAAPSDGVPLRPLVLAYSQSVSGLSEEEWRPLFDGVQDASGIRIQVQGFDGYAAVVDTIRAQRADLALLAPLSYVTARQAEPGIEPMAQLLSDGLTSYSAYLFVLRGSPVQRVQDLAGRRVAFVDELSTSGFLLPYAALLDQGVDPERDLAEVVFTGDHVASLRALAEGRVDAAASYVEGLKIAQRRAVEEGWALPPLRVLEDAGRVPLDTLCGGPSLGAPLRETLARLLLATNTSGPVGRAFFQSSGRVVGWAPVADPDFDEVRRVLRQVTEHRATPGAAP